MAEGKRIKASPVVLPPDTIQLTLTIEEAAHVRAILGEVTAGGFTNGVYDKLDKLLNEPGDYVDFSEHYAHSAYAILRKGFFE